MRKLVLMICLGLPFFLHAQSFPHKSVSLALFNNATLLPPASIVAVFTQPIHPGIVASYEFGWKEKSYGKWFQNANLGFFSHRYVYRALLLYTQAGYRRSLGHLTVEGSLHAGYMHAFLITDRLVPQDDGTYKAKKGFGKPQFIGGAGVGLGYNLGNRELGRRIFLNYDLRLQMPFVKSYVPLLPNGVLSLGFQTHLN
ncbi:MAG: hypothetical protein HXX13_07870 [Bacteroidetes bacterium]|nr:hypothetical protein [Bacteroidota bacterium]